MPSDDSPYEFLRVERLPGDENAGDVVVVTLDRPKVNALDTSLLLEIGAVAEACHADPPGALVLTGGERHFAAGADLTVFADPATRQAQGDAFRAGFAALETVPCPTIAAINGFALGGGAELAMCCDFRIAGEGAVFGQPEVLLGLIPGGGATQRLARLVGVTKAKELIWGGAQVKAPEALAIGWVDEGVADDQVLARAVERATGYAAGPRVAIRAAKRAIDEGIQGRLADGIDLELDLFMEVFESEDAANGVASFFEHGPGKATFKGR